MPIVAAAAMPTLPTDDDLALLDALPPASTAVLLVAGGELLAHHASTAAASSSGGRSGRVPITIDEQLLRAIARRGQAPRTHTSVLTGGLGALAATVSRTRAELAVVPMTVGARAQPWALAATAIGIAAAIDVTDRDTVIVACGDLGDSVAGGDDDARRWDERAAAALSDGDARAFAALGPDDAGHVAAAGWAPLTVLLTLIEQRDLHVHASTYRLDGRLGRVAARALPIVPGRDQRRTERPATGAGG